MDYKIVVFGIALSGKTTILQAVARKYSGDMEVSPIVGRLSGGVESRALHVSFPYSLRRIEVVTLAGTPWDMSAWDVLFAGADVSLLVVDPQPPRLDVALFELAHFSACPTAPRLGALQVTKLDLAVHSLPLIEVSKARRSIDGALAIFESRIDREETLTCGIDFLLSRMPPERSAR